MRRRRTWSSRTDVIWTATLCLGLAGSSVGCEEKTPEPEGAQRAPSARPKEPTQPKIAAKPPSPSALPALPLGAVSAPRVLYSASESPYGATLAFDGPAVLLATPKNLVRLVPGAAPQVMARELGTERVFLDKELVFYEGGAFRAMSKTGGPPRVVTKQESEPSLLVGEGETFVWAEPVAQGGARLRIWAKGRASKLHETSSNYAALTLEGESVFFVEQGLSVDAGTSWRLGRVSRHGGEPKYLPGQGDRTPSMLAARAGSLYYYDGPGRSVRRLGADFQSDARLASGLVCSPLAVGARLVCARVEGLFEAPLEGPGQPVALTDKPYGLVAALAVDAGRVVWLADTGKEHLTLRELDLPKAE